MKDRNLFFVIGVLLQKLDLNLEDGNSSFNEKIIKEWEAFIKIL
jgi:pyruvate dehydrogenase complex dehydrogenase (E1) component